MLVLLGQVLELRARDATSGAIKALLQLAPKTARRVGADGTDHEVEIDSLAVGDRLRVRPGEKVPVDGVILEGRSALDESLVTGESMPVTKESGDKVIAGTLNQSGGFVMRADKVGRDTLLSQIVQMVADAQRSRAPIQRLADQVAGWFVPAVIVVALLAFGAWSTFGPEPRMAYGLVAAVSVLIIACPCALGLATPMSIMVGVGRGAQAGVLIKNAEALERMEKIDTLVVDKTGTLTEGKPKVVGVVTTDDFEVADVVRFAASVERASEHPLADAIVQAAKERNLELGKVEEFYSPTGKGATGKVDGKTVVLGNANYLASLGIDTSSLQAQSELMRRDGATVINVAVDGELAALFAIADPIKASTRDALKALAAEGIKVIMLTGDNRTTAEAVARTLGIADVEAEVLPDQKSAVVTKLQKSGQIVAMAGDGVNDAPALAAAEVGIAMGTGTDVAMESAGITLLGGDLGGIVRARKLSQATMRNIRQNLFFAFVYNAAGIPIAAGILYPDVRPAAVADHRRRGDGVVLGERGRECVAVAGDGSCTRDSRSPDAAQRAALAAWCAARPGSIDELGPGSAGSASKTRVNALMHATLRDRHVTPPWPPSRAAIPRGPCRRRAPRPAFPISGSRAPRPVSRYRCRS